jgi:hypothetical protein
MIFGVQERYFLPKRSFAIAHEDGSRFLSTNIGEDFAYERGHGRFLTGVLVSGPEFNLDLWAQVLVVFEILDKQSGGIPTARC